MRPVAPAVFILVIAVVCVATPARAQQFAVSFAAYGTLGLDDLDGTLPPAVELRASVPTARRFAAEPFVTIGRGRRGAEGLYGVQVRQALRSSQGPTGGDLFLTYGGGGYYSSRGVQPPIIGSVGVGWRQRTSDRLAWRSDLQLVTFHVVPIGVRFALGVSFGR